MVRTYEDLRVWKCAMDLADRIYDVAKQLPAEERFGLASQLRRAAVSVPSNIAEGQGRRTTGEFVHFLGVARGSLSEVHTQLLLAQRRSYIQAGDVAAITGCVRDCQRLLNRLITVLLDKKES